MPLAGALLLTIAGIIPFESMIKIKNVDSSAMETLRMRFAKGEISKEEFEEKRILLEK